MIQKRPKTVPFSIRLTPEERADLERRAGRQALGDYIRARLFGANRRPDQQGHRSKHRTVIADQKTVAQALARLGQSDLARSLSSLAASARLGILPVAPETEAAILRTCRDIAAMKSALMAALHIKED